MVHESILFFSLIRPKVSWDMGVRKIKKTILVLVPEVSVIQKSTFSQLVFVPGSALGKMFNDFWDLTTGEPGSESRSQRFHHLRLSEDWFPKTTPKDSRFLRPLAFEVFGARERRKRESVRTK